MVVLANLGTWEEELGDRTGQGWQDLELGSWA